MSVISVNDVKVRSMKYPSKVLFTVPGFGGQVARVRIGGFNSTTKNNKVGKGIVSLGLTPQDWTDQYLAGEKFDLEQSQAVCGDCPLRQNRVCYVTGGATTSLGLVSQSKSTTGEVLDIQCADDVDWLVRMLTKRNRFLRLGEFGEPVLLGEELLAAICAAVPKWTGYTHQWRRPEYQWAKKYLMASTHGYEDSDEAAAMGWRYYRAGDDPVRDGEVMCPYQTHGVKCKTCGLCNGTTNGAKSIVNPLEVKANTEVV